MAKHSTAKKSAASKRQAQQDTLTVSVANIAADAHAQLGHRAVSVTLTVYTGENITARRLEHWCKEGEIFARLLHDRKCDPNALAAFDAVLHDGIMGPYFEGIRSDDLAGLYVLARIRHENNIPVSVDATVDALTIMREKLFGAVNEEITAAVMGSK